MFLPASACRYHHTSSVNRGQGDSLMEGQGQWGRYALYRALLAWNSSFVEGGWSTQTKLWTRLLWRVMLHCTWRPSTLTTELHGQVTSQSYWSGQHSWPSTLYGHSVVSNNTNVAASVVTASNILPSVGFGRLCKKNRGFRFSFGSHNKCIVNFFMPMVIWYDNFHHPQFKQYTTAYMQ